MKKILLLIIPGLFLYSCEKTADNVDIPDIDPKIVVQSFLTENEDSIIVYVSWSTPIYGTSSYGFNDIKNAEVKITNNTDSIKLTYIAGNTSHYNDYGYYAGAAAPLNIKAGKSYTLDISEPKGNHITAKTTIPEKPNFTLSLLKIDSTKSDWAQYGYAYKFTYNFKSNNSNDVNYYTIKKTGYSNYYGGGGKDSIILNFIYQGSKYIKVQKGETISLICNSYFPLDSAKVYIFHTDKSYYEYHKSIELNRGGDNPFSEPVIIYSNIKNGLGVFCSYNMDSKSFNY